MALIPTKQRISDFTNIVAEMNTFLTGVAGWVIDKYVTDSELYIHTTSAADSTVAYYSMQLVAVDSYQQALVIYPNTGFNTGSLVDAQPGVPTNASGALSYKIVHGTSLNYREGFLVANENFFFVTCMMPLYENLHNYDYCYGGNVDKDFAFTGGQFLAGNAPYEASSPPSTMYYDNGVADWYTEDGGAFADVGGKALVINQVHYDASAAVGYSHANTHLNAVPMVLFVEHDGGFAPLAQVHKLGKVVNLNNHLIPYGEIRIANVDYLSVPTGRIDTDHVIVESGAY